jgi:anaerobic magnesium-protoporphyrin IX monomethyl ester cyclase
MNTPRVLLLTPNWRWDRTPLSTDTLHPPPTPPLEMAYISSTLQCEHELVDAYVRDLSPELLRAEIEQFAPSVVVVASAASILYWRCPPFSVDAVSIAVDVIRDSAVANVIVIGPHGTASPAWLLRRTGADACWRGAVEVGLGAWLSGCGDGRYVHRVGASSQVRVERARDLPTASMAILAEQATYPAHMWCVTDDERRVAVGCRAGAVAEASRGCPWKCVYCAKAPVRDAFDARPLDRVRAELEELASLGNDYVFFIDETFNLGPRRVASLLEILASLGLRFGFQGRPELITASQATALADAGCVYVELGVDAGDDQLSARIDRRQSLNAAYAGIEACSSTIPVVRYNRLNLATLDYRRYLGLDGSDGWDYPPDPAYPYPGTPLGEHVMQAHGRSEFDWDFALRYSWWLRIEVAHQRDGSFPGDEAVEAEQRAFLDLSADAAAAAASALEGIQDDPTFASANKFVNGRRA